MLINVLFLILLLGICPYIIGFIGTRNLEKSKNTLSLNFLVGYVIMWGCFEVLALICHCFHVSLNTLTILYAITCIAAIICSVIKNGKRMLYAIRQSVYFLFYECPLMFVVIILILFQTKYVTIHQHIDDDDAFYVASAETSVTTNTIMEINPYNGEPYTFTAARYVLSPFPVFTAVISNISHIPSAVIAHTFMPIFFIFLGYMVYYLLATVFWPEDSVNRTIFLLFTATVIMFSGYSVYPQGTFFLFRLWQGKAVLAAILLPAILYMGLKVGHSISLPQTLLLLMAELSCCLVSSMGIILGAIMLGVTAIANVCIYRNWKNIAFMFPCCVPNMILSIIYIIIR